MALTTTTATTAYTWEVLLVQSKEELRKFHMVRFCSNPL